MRFKILKGNGEGGKEGDVIDSDKPLDKAFPDKFQRVDDVQPVLVTSPLGREAKAPAPAKATAAADFDDDADDDHTGDETKDIPSTKKSTAERSTLPKRNVAHTPTRPVRR